MKPPTSRYFIALGTLIVVLGLATTLLVFRGGSDSGTDTGVPLAPRSPSPSTLPATPSSPAAPTASPATPVAEPTLPPLVVHSTPVIAVIVTSPQSVVFQEVGESVTLEVKGLYSDTTEQILPDQAGAAVTFTSADRSVATVDSAGRITAVSPGGVEILVEYGGVRAGVPVIVYGPYVDVPPYDPQRVIELAPGTRIVVNRVIVRPAGDVYDRALVQVIAAEYGGQVIAEWLNLRAFCLEFQSIDSSEELGELLLRMSDDPRVAAIELDGLYTVSDYHISPGSAYGFAGLPKAARLLETIPDLGNEVHIAVIDTGMSLKHTDARMQQVIDTTFDRSRISPNNLLGSISGGSHGLSVASVIVGQNGAFGVAGPGKRAIPYRLHLYDVSGSDGPDVAAVASALAHIQSHHEFIAVVNMSISIGCGPGRSSKELLAGIVAAFGFGPPYIVVDRDLAPDILDYIVCAPRTKLDSNRFVEMPDTLFVTSAGNVNIKHDGNGNEVSRSYGDPRDVFPGAWASEQDNIISVGSLEHYVWHDTAEEMIQPPGYDPMVDRFCETLFGEGITIAAEGASVYVMDANPPHGYRHGGGTSYSSPIVAGSAALLAAIVPSLNPAEIRLLLVDTARKVEVDSGPRGCGDATTDTWRDLNAAAAVMELLDTSITAEFRCCREPVQLDSRGVSLELDLVNTGRRPWDFHIHVSAESPSGERKAVPPGESDVRLVRVGALQKVPVSVSFDASEPGEWKLRAVVSRGQLIGGRTGPDCSNGLKVWTCLDEFERLIRVDGEQASSTATTTPAPVTVQEPPRPAVFLQRPTSSLSSLEPVMSPEELLASSLASPSPDATPTPAATPQTTATVTPAATPPTTATVTPAATPPTTATVTPAATPPTTATVTPAATPPTTATVTPAATPPTTATVTPAATPTPPVTLAVAPTPTATAGLILTSISVGPDHTCGVKPDGSVICWGRNQWGQTEPPDGTFTSVSAGGGHTCGVRTDGSVACWGSAGEAKATPPSGSFQSVSAGPEHTCGIRTDGSVVCWGSSEVFNPAESPPGSFTSVGAGQYHTCGVMDDGSITCWGWYFVVGQPPAGEFASISVYGRDQCAVRIDSSLACWGTEGTGLTSPPAGSFESVSAGPNRACGITTDGAAVCWGEGTSDPLLKPDGSFASIALGQDHYCGLRPDGAVACWGSNGEDRSLPPESLFVTVHPAEGYFCGLRADGSVTCRDSEARTTGSWGLQFSPSVPFLDVSAASLWGCGVRTSGELTCWGEPIRLDSLDRVGARPTGSFLEVSISNNHGCALKADGSIACWGGDAEGETDAPPGSFVSVHVGTEYSCGLRADGAAACWGNGIEADAATIDGTFTSIDVGRFRGCGLRTNGDIECWHGGSLAPGRESDPTNPFVSVTVGSWLACGLRSDGTADCWAIDDHQTPLAVPGGQFTFIEATSAGGSSAHVCGVRPDGSVTCWLAAP